MSVPRTRPPRSFGKQWLHIVKVNMRANGRKPNDAQYCAKLISFRRKTLRKLDTSLLLHVIRDT